MRVRLNIIISCILFVSAAGHLAYAESNSLEEVLKFPEKFSGAEVQIEGEIIGEPLKDNRGLWFNISTGPYQIGVFSADRNKVAAITRWGDYNVTGDRVRVKGVFYKECPEHQISDIHLSSLEIIEQGHSNRHPISPQKQQLAKILSLICLFVAFIYLIKIKYGKRN